MSWTLDEAATVSLSLERLVRTRCGLSRKLCSRWVAAGSLRRGGARVGKGSMKLSTRVRGKNLRAGRYRLVALGADAAGNRAAPLRAAFRVR